MAVTMTKNVPFDVDWLSSSGKEWVQVIDEPGWEINHEGEIRSWRKGGYNGLLRDEPIPIKGVVNSCGYLRIPLRKNSAGKRGTQSLARLVAKHFVPPYHGEVIRHMDDNPLNNHPSNLRWGTQKDNIQDCINHGHFSHNMTKEINELGRRLAQPHNEAIRIPLKATNIHTGEIRYFESLCDAEKQLGVYKGSIDRCIRNPDKLLRAGDWHFERDQSEYTIISTSNKSFKKDA